MRIIENNYRDKEQEYEITCPHCGSKIAYTFDDVVSGGGSEWLYCGACNKEIPLSEDELSTIDTVQYPKDFFSFVNGVSLKDNEINNDIKECLNDLDKDTDFSYRASGDTIVFAYKSDESLPAATVVVTKNYQETDVKISRKNF